MYGMVWHGMAWYGMYIYIYIYMYTYIIYGANIGKSLMNGDLMILMGQVMENMMIYFWVGGAIFSEKAKWEEELLGVVGMSTATEATYSTWICRTISEQGSFYFPFWGVGIILGWWNCGSPSIYKGLERKLSTKIDCPQISWFELLVFHWYPPVI